MPVIDGRKVEKDGVMTATGLILDSARTAPKSCGIDDIVTAVVYGEEKRQVEEEMYRIADKRGIWGFKRDADSLRKSEVLVLIGVRGTQSVGLDCGACGNLNCATFDEVLKQEGEDYLGPNCLFKSLDLGIARGSAVKTASSLNIDNRIMYRVGTAARRLGMLPRTSVVMGIPLSATGKSPYFDRASHQENDWYSNTIRDHSTTPAATHSTCRTSNPAESTYRNPGISSPSEEEL